MLLLNTKILWCIWPLCSFLQQLLETPSLSIISPALVPSIFLSLRHISVLATHTHTLLPLHLPHTPAPPTPPLPLWLVPVSRQTWRYGFRRPTGSAACWALRLWTCGPWAGGEHGSMLTMNLEGLEMIAVLVVVVLFVKVLERFGLLTAGYDGKQRWRGCFLQRRATCCWSLNPLERELTECVQLIWGIGSCLLVSVLYICSDQVPRDV